jgi:hypothetical protein
MKKKIDDILLTRMIYDILKTNENILSCGIDNHKTNK